MQGTCAEEEEEREDTGELLVRAAETMAKFDAQLKESRSISEHLRDRLARLIARGRPIKVLLRPIGRAFDRD